MNSIWESLYSKNGLAAKQIAKELITVQAGGRIPRVSDFAERFSLGNGTVQGALKVLDNLHAIQLESRGHLGTFLIKKDLHLLKEVAGEGAIIGAMPLPYSLKYEGLATGLIEVSEKLLNRIDLAYMRGSKQRLDTLKSRRYDFIIVSELAAEEEIKLDPNLELVLNFGPQSYVTRHQIFFANKTNKKIKNGMRIGVDQTSMDQSTLTFLECEGKDVEMVPVNYMQLFDMLLNGEIDAAVWNSDENRSREAFSVGDFQSKRARKFAGQASAACMLIEKDRDDIKDYIHQLNKEQILSIQQKVVNKDMFPHY